jgi:exodeoxyribonuclease VII large subunit
MPDLFLQPDAAPWTPTLLTKAARRVLEGGIGPLWLRAELSGLKIYQSGHWYFTLRDAGAQVRAVMWRQQAIRIPTPPEDGTQVFVFGTPTVWEEKGEFRLTVTDLLVTDQIGRQQRELERVRKLLEKDGLFDTARKRPLPALPQRVAVVTSLDGAALHDIVTVTRRRWPAVELFVVGARVQGAEAAADLVQALRLVNRIPRLDLCIVGRGGGGREDLHIFNNEAVCRALAEVHVPTISAVGHETDVSLTDFVADVRAPTPSAAVEMAIPDRDDLSRRVAGLALRLAGALGRGTRLARERLVRAGDRLEGALQRRLDEPRRGLDLLAAQLDALSPLRVLDRGYSVARDSAGRVLRRVEQFRPGLPFGLRVSNGDVRARVDAS